MNQLYEPWGRLVPGPCELIGKVSRAWGEASTALGPAGSVVDA
nr:hypothetical protein [uncultured Novosphingobium sp.]